MAHLDKSHVTVHTYPEYHPETSLATFRVDIDVATCGEITPLSTLDYLIGSFDSDIITMDYRVRGFTRSIDGKKVFNDGNVTSIQEFISPATLKKYDAVDINVYAANLFHTKMLLKEIDLQNYLFNRDAYRDRALQTVGDHRQPAPRDDRNFQRTEYLLRRRAWIRRVRLSSRRWKNSVKCAWSPLTCPGTSAGGAIPNSLIFWGKSAFPPT